MIHRSRFMDILKLNSIILLLCIFSNGCTIYIRGDVDEQVKEDLDWESLDPDQKINAMNKFCPIYLIGPGSVNVDESSADIDNSMITSDISDAIDTLSYGDYFNSYMQERKLISNKENNGN